MSLPVRLAVTAVTAAAITLGLSTPALAANDNVGNQTCNSTVLCVGNLVRLDPVLRRLDNGLTAPGSTRLPLLIG